MPITITPITPADIPSAVQCIQSAFTSDPYENWVFRPPPLFNTTRNYHSLRAKCEWGIRNALFYVAKDSASGTPGQPGEPGGPERVLGVSMWMKPRKVSAEGKAEVGWGEWWDEYVLWFKQGVNLLWYRGRGGLRTDRYWVWKREQAAAQAELWTDPEGYYFCNIVVVDPSTQGKGVGKMLFEIVMRQADEEGRRCYLESSRDVPNVAIYEKMGFEMRKRMRCVAEDGTGEGCDLFCMVREPKGKP